MLGTALGKTSIFIRGYRKVLGLLPILMAGVNTYAESATLIKSQDFCSLYPLAISSQVLGSPQEGQAFQKIPTDSGDGNFSLMSWTGKNDTNTFADSLLPPGNSNTYINHNDPTDHKVDIGDWVQGSPGVKNANKIRTNLNVLLNQEIIVPVWGTQEGKGANYNYLVQQFAIIRLQEYQLNGKGWLSFIFERYTRCYNEPPVAEDGSLETEQNKPATITLVAADPDNDLLDFQLVDSPEHGTVSIVGNELTYTPEFNYHGPDSLTFLADDGEDLSNTATISITVKRSNKPPVIISPANEHATENTQYHYQIEAEDPNEDDILTYSVVSSPEGVLVEPSTGLAQWMPSAEYVGSVPVLNKQCYVVPAGSVQVTEEDNAEDTSEPTYIAPLFRRVQSALVTAGEYTAREAVAWDKRNNCLGCHVQTQSLLGLETSIDKADVDLEATEFLLNELLTSQQSDGSIRQSNPQHVKTQTALALWALGDNPDKARTFMVRARALDFFYNRRQISDNRIYWSQDHNTGWLNSHTSISALVSQAAARLIADSEQVELSQFEMQVVENFRSLLPGMAEYFLNYYQNADNETLHSVYRYIALSELKPYITDSVIQDRIDAAQTFLDQMLRDRQLDDGGWGRYASGQTSDPMITAWVGIALNYANPSLTDPIVLGAINYLLDTQQLGGTWKTTSGLFNTLFGSTSLVMAYLPVALEHLGNSDLRVGNIYIDEDLMDSAGNPVSGLRVSAEIHNRGIANTTAGVVANFYAGMDANGELLGSVNIGTMPSGGNYLASIELENADKIGIDLFVSLDVAPEIEECEIRNNSARAGVVRVQVEDIGLLTDDQIYAINVHDANQAPEITSEPDTIHQQAQNFDYQVTVADQDIGDAAIFSIQDGPDGLYIDPRTGKMSSDPTLLAAGVHEVTVLVEDLRGATTTQTFSIEIAENLPPEIVSDAVAQNVEGQPYQYPVEAIDPNNDELAFGLEQAPDGLLVDKNTGLINGNFSGYLDPILEDKQFCEKAPALPQALQPKVKWHWSGSTYRSSYKQVMSTPAVAQLNDDNDDGLINELDIPDIVFSAFSGRNYQSPAIIRALSGADGSEIWSKSDRWSTAMYGMAIGDIDHDGLVEIVVGNGYGRGTKSLVVYENDGALKWEVPVDQYGEPALADIDTDGEVEIIMANSVFDAHGTLKWKVASTDKFPVVGDLNLDGFQEVIISGNAYDYQGKLPWSYGGSKAAVGNFDEDDYPEIAVHTDNSVTLLNHDGTVVWGPVAIPGGGGGPLTIADVDADGEPEIGVAGAAHYVVFETNGSLKWAKPTQDLSSRQTGSSVFDFEGDGKAEVLYADELNFRIYDGETGSERFKIPNPSGTLYEYPLVVDVDNDNAAEVVVVANNYAFSGVNGIRVFEASNDDWAPTRKIWNQHSYHITNINDDGTVPQFEEPSWLTHNTYRLNTFTDYAALAQPDLAIFSVNYDDEAATVSATIRNLGLAPANSEITVHFYSNTAGENGALLGSVSLNGLAAGSEADISIPVSEEPLTTDIAVEIEFQSNLGECDTTNNHTVAALTRVRVEDEGGLFDTQSFAVSQMNSNDAPEITSAASSQAIAGQVYSFQIEASDIDRGDALKFAVQNAPGDLFVDPHTGLLSASGLTAGVYNFNITVTDLSGATHQMAHILTVAEPENLPPVINTTPAETGEALEEYHYQVQATDLDGDPVVFTLSQAPQGMRIDGVSGDIVWTPTREQLGLSIVDVTAADTAGASTNQRWVIDVSDPWANNTAPIITSTPSGNVVAGQTFTYQLIAEDAEGDSLNYSLGNAASGMQLSENGLFTWLASTDQVGETFRVSLTVDDGRGGQATQNLSLPVNPGANTPPVISSTPSTSATTLDTYIYNVEASDSDGDGVVFQLDTAPNGMTINAATGLVEWTPSGVQEGQLHDVVVRATDTRGAAAIQSFGIAVNAPVTSNEVPLITSSPQSPAIIGQAYQYQLIAIDPDGDSLNYSLSNGPDNMTINNEGLVSWTPTVGQLGDHSIALSVSDGRAVTTQSFILTVVQAQDPDPSNPANQYPVIGSEPLYEAVVEQGYVYAVLASDPDGDSLNYTLLSSPAGMSIDNSGVVEWLPASDQSGIHSVQLRVDDGELAVVQSFSIRVWQEAQPLQLFVNISPQVAEPGETVTVSVATTGGSGNVTSLLLFDGMETPLNSNGQAFLSSTEYGVHTIDVGVDTGDEQKTFTGSFSVLNPDDLIVPVAQISAPEHDSQITQRVSITGTASDDNIAEYGLYYSPRGSQQWTQWVSGTSSVIDGELGSFDPSMLLNGQYDIVLQVTDINGQTASDSIVLSVDGDLKVGNFSFTVEDLNIPMAGLPIRVTRTYDSRRRGEDLDFGYGWSVGYQDVKIEESRTPGLYWALNQYNRGPYGLIADFCVEPQGPPVVTVTLPTGDVERFEAAASPSCNTYQPILDVDLVFNAVGDTQSKLEIIGNKWGRLSSGQLVDTGDFVTPLDPDRYKLTTRAGYVYYLDQAFGIEKVVDPNGHTLTYSNSGIVHSAGKRVDFVRDSQGRITQVIDPSGNAINYSYDGRGDLTSVIERDSADTTYTYNNGHGLLDINDPLGRKLVKNIYDDSGRLIAQEDEAGNRTEFNHDIEGRQSIVTDRNGNPTFLYYDERGNVTSKVDALGNTSHYSFDERGNQLTMTDELGNVSSATFSSANDQLTATDALGNTTQYTYNTRGQELEITDAEGNVYRNTYDSVGNLLTVTDPDGNIAGNNIDIDGNVTSTVDALGHTTRYTYDGDGNKLTETDAEGHVTRFTYDANGNVLSETRSRTLANGSKVDETTIYEYDSRDRLIATTDPLGNRSESEFDLAGQQVASIDALGRRTEMSYDVYGRLTETRFPDGTIEKKTYDNEGNLLTESDRAGRVTRFAYDALNRQISTTYPDGSITRTEYDAAGRVSAEVDALGNRQEHTYDAAGRWISTKDALGNIHSFVYDANGNLEGESDANGNAMVYEYNTLDQRIATLYMDGTESAQDFDALSRRVSQTDQADISTQYGYDKLGRLTTVTDAAGNITRYSYDENGNKLTQTDAEGRVTRWAYDALGRVISRTLPLGQSEQFAYDTNGNMVRHTDFNGQVTLRDYDINNRPVTVTYADGQVETFDYDPLGNRISATDTSGTTLYDYDNRNRLIREIKPNGDSLEYSYDVNGNKVRLVVNHGDSSAITHYSYDELNRLATVTDGSGTTSYGYDAVGNRTSVSYPNGTSTIYHYDRLNRLTQLQTCNGRGALVEQYDYTLHPTGRRTQIDELDGRSSAYSYDNLYRLTQEVITDAINGNHTASYQFDKVGNRIYSTVNGVQTAFNYDANDRLQQQGGVSYSYDNNGNTLTETEDGVTTYYDYDARNKLIEVDRSGVITSYGYNVNGVRNRKTESGTTTRYLVDENRDYAQVLVEDTGSATVNYTYGDDLISQDRDGVTSFYHYDGLGSTRALSDVSGTLTDSYNYEAFGQLLNQTGTTENSYLFTGEQFDVSLDQYYLRARYYNQRIGRFTQMDTWMGNNHDPVTLHKYLYANTDPVMYIDPTGNFSLGSVMSAVNTVGRLASTGVRAVGSSALRFAQATQRLGKQTVVAGRTVIIRVQYMKRVKELRKIADELRKSGKSSEEIAKILNRKRRALGRLFKHATDAKTRQNAFVRNMEKYGDKWGPTWQYLRRQGKSWDDIIESSARPNSSLQELTKIFFGR